MDIERIEDFIGGLDEVSERYSSSRGSSGRRSRSYYVTVVFDHPEKLLCKLIQTTKADYEKIEKGTPVLLIKTGPIYSVRIAE